MSKDEKIRKFWIRGPEQLKDGKRVGAGKPITLVVWRRVAESDLVVYALATCNPTPSKKTGKPDVFSRKQAHKIAMYKLLNRGKNAVGTIPKDADVKASIIACIVAYGRTGTRYHQAAVDWCTRAGLSLPYCRWAEGVRPPSSTEGRSA